MSVRRAEARRAEGIVEEEIQAFAGWLGSLDVVPTLTALRAHGDAVVDGLLAENAGRWESLSERDRERVELLARTVVSRLLHEPTTACKGLEAEQRHARLQLLRELFGLEEVRPGRRPRRPPRSAPSAPVDAAAHRDARQPPRSRPGPRRRGRAGRSRPSSCRSRPPATSTARGATSRAGRARWRPLCWRARSTSRCTRRRTSPGELAAGTAIVAAPRRADPTTCSSGAGAGRRARGARVGTSALRRRAQLLAARPDLDMAEIRGNVDTRLRKLAGGEVDVLVLAAAGLDRLDRRSEAGGALTGDVFVPAAGQGVIAVQARASGAAAETVAALFACRTFSCLRAERSAVRALGASCNAPVGIHADVVADGLRVRGFAGLPDGSSWLVDEIVLSSGEQAAEAAGEAIAARMNSAGAAELLRDAEAMVT
jgi:hydroxymethylbilane synthase